MSGWLGVLEAVGVAILLVVVALALLAARRRWLSREGGTFECSARLRQSTPSGGWALGVARYNGEMLEWFRFFSYAFRPRITLRRGEVRVLESRDPDPVEALALYEGQRVVRLGGRAESSGGPVGTGRTPGWRGPARDSWELAMDQDSLTGLLSWLEAAPPGVPAAS